MGVGEAKHIATHHDPSTSANENQSTLQSKVQGQSMLPTKSKPGKSSPRTGAAECSIAFSVFPLSTVVVRCQELFVTRQPRHQLPHGWH